MVFKHSLIVAKIENYVTSSKAIYSAYIDSLQQK